MVTPSVPGGAMAAFDHIMVLLSFVFALALTHLLSRLGTAMFAASRSILSPLLFLAMINAIALVLCDWLVLWDEHNIAQWDLASIAVNFALAISVFFVCAAVAPETPADGAVDMEQYYWRNRRPIWITQAASNAVAMLANFVFLETPNKALFLESTLASAPFFIPPILALSVPARWAQWVSGFALLALIVGFTIAFSGTLK